MRTSTCATASAGTTFFRDPPRTIPTDVDALVRPADGTVTQVETIDEPDFTVLSQRSTAVLRWELSPGSTLFIVWQQSRQGSRTRAQPLHAVAPDVLTRPGLDVPLHGLPLLGLRLALTGGLAELSWRLVEHPVRSGAVSRWWAARRERMGRAGRLRAKLYEPDPVAAQTIKMPSMNPKSPILLVMNAFFAASAALSRSNQ